jgi:hypothetical protein
MNAMEKIIELKLIEFNVTRNELRQKLGIELRKLLQFEVNFFGLTNFSLSNNTIMSFLDNYNLCYQVPVIVFSSTSDYAEFSINTSSRPDFSGFFGDLSDFESLSTFKLDFNAHLTQVSPDVDTDALGLLFTSGNGVCNTLSVGILGQYSMISKINENKKCVNERTKEVCQAKCRIQLIEKLCNCSPSTWPSLLPPNAKECTLSQYKLCLDYNVTEDLKCRNDCSDPCEQWEFYNNQIRYSH